jgi:hypothetical protein
LPERWSGGRDLGVREAVAGQPRDLSLLGSELIAGRDISCADPLAGGQQIALGARGEAFGAHACEHLMSDWQDRALISPTAQHGLSRT